jgi:hypothetical protein
VSACCVGGFGDVGRVGGVWRICPLEVGGMVVILQSKIKYEEYERYVESCYFVFGV